MALSAAATTFILADRLPWPDDAPLPPGKGDLEAAAVYAGGTRRECSIRNISRLGVTICAELRNEPGEAMAIELGIGRRAGSLAWVQGGEAGIAFNEPIDVMGLINRQLISQPAERRKMPRVEVNIPIHLRYRGLPEPVTLRNISAGGLQVEGGELPPQGTLVSVLIEDLVVPAGEVVWSRKGLAGIELFEELRWTSIVPWIRETMRRDPN